MTDKHGYQPGALKHLKAQKPGAIGAPLQVSAGRQGASVVDEDSQRVIVQAELMQDGYLVLLDSDYPGWRVTINGQPPRS